MSAAARGSAMPKNTPKPVVDRSSGAVKRVTDPEEFEANAVKAAVPGRFHGAVRRREGGKE